MFSLHQPQIEYSALFWSFLSLQVHGIITVRTIQRFLSLSFSFMLFLHRLHSSFDIENDYSTRQNNLLIESFIAHLQCSAIICWSFFSLILLPFQSMEKTILRGPYVYKAFSMTVLKQLCRVYIEMICLTACLNQSNEIDICTGKSRCFTYT